jgi:hypothetical protein
MKANFVTFHDDGCKERLQGGYCPVCRFIPDMQSISGAYFCPSCNVELNYKDMRCPRCSVVFEKPY